MFYDIKLCMLKCNVVRNRRIVDNVKNYGDSDSSIKCTIVKSCRSLFLAFAKGGCFQTEFVCHIIIEGENDMIIWERVKDIFYWRNDSDVRQQQHASVRGGDIYCKTNIPPPPFFFFFFLDKFIPYNDV